MEINISFCFDKNYYRQATVAILSLLLKAKENGKNIHYNLHLLVDKNVNIKIQNEIIENLSMHYTDLSVYFKNIDKTFDKSYECRGISRACYYRLLLHRIFPELDYLIYSDVDVIFNTDLSEFADFDITNFYYASNKDIIYNTKKGRQKVLKSYKYWNNELKNIGKNYRNSGFLLLNLKELRDLNIDEKIIKLSKKSFNFQDQDVLNILFINKQNRIATLSPKYATLAGAREKGLYKIALDENIINESEFNEIMSNPAIIHYAGRKPWDSYNKAEGDIWWNFVKQNDVYFRYFQDNLNKKIEKQKFLQNIFSIKNENTCNKKYKVIKILRFSLKFQSK